MFEVLHLSKYVDQTEEQCGQRQEITSTGTSIEPHLHWQKHIFIKIH